MKSSNDSQIIRRTCTIALPLSNYELSLINELAQRAQLDNVEFLHLLLFESGLLCTAKSASAGSAP